MTASIHDHRIGCLPSPSVPAETLIEDGWLTFLLFFAMSEEPGPNGFLENLGVAVVECVSCSMTKFGYPNDEGLPEHPLFRLGLGESHPIVEVRESAWASEVVEQMRASARRIWRGRGRDPEERGSDSRHFIVLLKEATFECVATDLRVTHYAKDFADAFAYVRSRMAEH